jgi:hypothetical protein
VLRTLPTKAWQRFPERHGNILTEVVTIAGGIGIAGGQTDQRGVVSRQKAIETLLQDR